MKHLSKSVDLNGPHKVVTNRWMSDGLEITTASSLDPDRPGVFASHGPFVQHFMSDNHSAAALEMAKKLKLDGVQPPKQPKLPDAPKQPAPPKVESEKPPAPKVDKAKPVGPSPNKPEKSDEKPKSEKPADKK